MIVKRLPAALNLSHANFFFYCRYEAEEPNFVLGILCNLVCVC